MENQETDDIKFDINEKDFKKKLLKGGILEIESVLDQLIKDVMQDDSIHKPAYNFIFKELLIEFEDELTSPLLKKNERIYKKVQVNKLKKLIKKLENEKEINQYFETLVEKEIHLKEKSIITSKDFTRLELDLNLLDKNLYIDHSTRAKAIQNLIESKNHYVFGVIAITSKVKTNTIHDYIRTFFSKEIDYFNDQSERKYIELQSIVKEYLGQ